jgi:hypothetical protein
MDVDYAFTEQEDLVIPKGLERSGVGPSPFEVSLFSYSTQPWTNRNANLVEWFNYGFNPTTWTKYCLQQMNIFHTSNAQVPAAAQSVAQSAAQS